MITRLREEINAHFVGKEDVVDNLLVCLLAGGHVLLEDVPGVGKTTAVKAMAGAIACSFGRIQFTPDTLPSDVVGVTAYNMKTSEFEYRQGAIMHQVILADEINRTSPKTQACLLEAMAEKQVTIDGNIYQLPEPFIVIATQNPVEFLGTYPLPEAQLDRFMMRLSIGYPDEKQEIMMARNQIEKRGVEAINAVLSAEDVIELRKRTEAVYVSDGILTYVQEMISLTRDEHRFVLGASPRATIALVRAAQAKAFIEGRDFVKPDDVKAVAVNVLHHRLTLTSEAKIKKEDVDRILQSIVVRAKIPME